jgi:hypothetical protein
MDRRGFLKLFGGTTGALVATATMAQAGMLAELMDWLRRAPAWSFPSKPALVEHNPLFDEISATTLESLRDDIVFDNFFVDSLTLRKLRINRKLEPFNAGRVVQTPFEFDSVPPAFCDWGAL